MSPVRATLIAGVIALAAQTTQAADILPPPPPVMAPASMPAAEFSGWYLRGDVGIGKTVVADRHRHRVLLLVVGTSRHADCDIADRAGEGAAADLRTVVDADVAHVVLR